MLTATEVACPNCTKGIRLSQPTVGKKLRCPQCGCPFTVTARDLGLTPSLPPPLPAITAAPPPIMPSVEAVPPTRTLLIAGVLGGLVLLLGGAAGLALYFANREAPGGQQAAVENKQDDKPATPKKGPPKEDDAGPPATWPTDRPAEREEPVRPTGYERPREREDRPRPDEPERTRPRPEPEPPMPFEVKTHSDLSPEEQKLVNQAIEKGVAFLKKTQLVNGSWTGPGHPMAMAALPALTLLECGVPASDHSIQQAATFVRDFMARTRTQKARVQQTYDTALAILFLDRLGDKQDAALLRTLGLRLVAGQTAAGGWSYTCPVHEPKIETSFLSVLEQTRPRNPLELFVTGNDGRANLEMIGIDASARLTPELIGMASKLDPDAPFRGVAPGVSKLKPDGSAPDLALSQSERLRAIERTDAARKALDSLPRDLQNVPSLRPPSTVKNMPFNDQSDNSNTQFAILGVLAASRHGVPTDRAMGLLVQRFRTSQNADGSFGYNYARGGGMAGSPAMTGAGLLGLAVTHGLTAGMKVEGMAAKSLQDKGIQKALTALSRNIERPLGKAIGPRGGRSQINLYFLWTVERVGMLYGLPRINDKDWYHWGAEELLHAQTRDGYWSNGGYHMATPSTDTCFALLFLKRANLAKDLTTKIQSKLELIIDEK